MRISDWSSDVCSSDLAHGLDRDVRLDTEVTDARFDPADNRWTVTAADGRAWRAPALIVATGQLNRVNIPDIPGREGFAGAQFHTARWDASVDLAGKRVGVIGRSEEHTSELQSLMRISYAAFCLKKKKKK